MAGDCPQDRVRPSPTVLLTSCAGPCALDDAHIPHLKGAHIPHLKGAHIPHLKGAHIPHLEGAHIPHLLVRSPSRQPWGVSAVQDTGPHGVVGIVCGALSSGRR